MGKVHPAAVKAYTTPKVKNPVGLILPPRLEPKSRTPNRSSRTFVSPRRIMMSPATRVR